MTFSNISGRPQTVVGASIYNCFNTNSYTHKDTDYHYLPSNVSRLNSSMPLLDPEVDSADEDGCHQGGGEDHVSSSEEGSDFN